MTKFEKWALGISSAISGSIIFVNPTIMLTAMILFVNPTSLFEANPWYLSLPLLGLIALGVLYGYYHRFRSLGRIIVWSLSITYWGGWCVYWLIDLTPFAKYWIIWGPHAAVVLASFLGIYGINRSNKQLQPTAESG